MRLFGGFVLSNFLIRRMASSGSGKEISFSGLTSQVSQFNQTNATPCAFNFALGQPSPSLLPLNLIRDSMEQQWKNQQDPLVLQYGKGPGFDSFRETLASYLTSRYGFEVKPSELMVTCGNSQAIDLVSRLFLEEGSLVGMEQPSYFLARFIFDAGKSQRIPIPMDEEGMVVDYLQTEIEKGNIPKLVYTIPNYHNPTAICLSESRKRQLVDLASKYNFHILADEPYNFLHFDSSTPHPASLMKYDEGRGVVLSAGSFSKILAPGLRLGWLHADKKIVERMLGHGIIRSGGGLNPFVAFSIEDLIKSGSLDKNILNLNSTLSARCQAMCEELDLHLPKGCTFRAPNGGYFVWIQLPSTSSAASVLELAKTKYSVTFTDGTRCSMADGEEGLANCLRVSFSFYEIDEIRAGIRQLCSAIQEHLQK